MRAEIGFCIYCGCRGTSTEHVIPNWACGNVELGKASCDGCAQKINRGIENPMSRGPFWSARLYLGFPSRRKHRDPLPVTLIYADGSEREVKVTADDNPARLVLTTFPGPNIYRDDQPTERPNEKQTILMSIYEFDTSTSRRFAEKYPSAYLSLGVIAKVQLARLLAKVAHGLAVFHHGNLAFTPLLRDFILHGTSGVEATHFVGSDRFADKTDHVHTVTHYWEVIRGVEHLIYEVSLFAFAGTPVYKVVVGTRPTWRTADEALAVWGPGD